MHGRRARLRKAHGAGGATHTDISSPLYARTCRHHAHADCCGIQVLLAITKLSEEAKKADWEQREPHAAYDGHKADVFAAGLVIMDLLIST